MVQSGGGIRHAGHGSISSNAADVLWGSCRDALLSDIRRVCPRCIFHGSAGAAFPYLSALFVSPIHSSSISKHTLATCYAAGIIACRRSQVRNLYDLVCCHCGCLDSLVRPYCGFWCWCCSVSSTLRYCPTPTAACCLSISCSQLSWRGSLQDQSACSTWTACWSVSGLIQ